ncbi:MAG: HipA domain-containing protein [Microthrixaceae bacterium]
MTRADKFADINVGGWTNAHEEPLGTKPKRWLRDPATKARWLMKDVTFNRRADGTLYAKGDDWAERIACAVAHHLELPTATVELAHFESGADLTLGVISRSVVAADESLVHGNELLEEVGVFGADPHDRTGYNLDAVRRSLTNVAAPSDRFGSAWEAFVGYLILDALIGNTDRHQENWAAIDNAGLRRLAPTFDHASCLGFQLDDSQRRERLASTDANRGPDAYAARARSRFEGSPVVMTVAIDAFATLPAPGKGRWADAVGDVDALVGCIARVPDDRMSEPSREFAEGILRANQSKMAQTIVRV